MHEMLIGYVNGTLDPLGKSSFETHLSRCPSCRAELPVLEKLRAQVESLGEDVLSGHPSPAELVNSVLPEPAEELPEERRAEVRRHLSICSTCAEETRWVLGTEKAIAPKRLHAIAAPSKRPVRAWKWAAATAALLALAVSLPLVARFSAPPRTAVGRIALVEAAQREGPSSEVVVTAESATVQLLFRVDLGPGDFPAAFELIDTDGRLVHRDSDVLAADLYRERFLLFTCSRGDCPDGRYVGRLRPAGGIAVEYPFRIETETSLP